MYYRMVLMSNSQNKWLIMKELWEESPLTLKQLCDGESDEQDLSEQEIDELLAILNDRKK